MAVAFVASSGSNTATDNVASTSITASTPSSSIGDLILCWLSLTNGTATAPTVTAPSGWTLVASTTDGASPQLFSGLYQRVVQSGDSSAPVWSFSTGANASQVMVAYSGCDPTTPFTNARVDPYTGSTAAKSTESITTTVAGWIVSGFGDRSGGGYSAFADTFRVQARNSAYATPSSSWLQDSNGDVAAGAQVRTATGPAGTGVGSSFILRLNPFTSTGVNAEVAAGAGVAYDARPLSSPLKEWLLDIPKVNRAVTHRGGSADFVEMTAAAYAEVDARKILAMEISMWRTSDGVWVASHDRDTVRMFGTSIDIPTNPWSALAGLTTTVGGYPMARVTDLLDLYAGTHILFVDNKQDQNVTSFLDMLDAYPQATGRFVVKSFFSTVNTALAARLRGYTTWGYYYEVDLPNLAATHQKWDILGMEYSASTGPGSAWEQIKAVGKPVLGHVCLSVNNVNTAFAAGADGVMTGKVLGGAIPNALGGQPAAAGQAFAATVTTLVPAPAGQPTGTGTAYDGTVSTSSSASPAAGLAAGTGTAYDATAATSGNTSALAEQPAAAGVAYDATVSTSSATTALAEVATGTGTAYPATVLIRTTAGVATAVGWAPDAGNQTAGGTIGTGPRPLPTLGTRPRAVAGMTGGTA